MDRAAENKNPKNLHNQKADENSRLQEDIVELKKDMGRIKMDIYRIKMDMDGIKKDLRLIIHHLGSGTLADEKP